MMATTEAQIALERSGQEFIDKQAEHPESGRLADKNMTLFGTPFPVMEYSNLPTDAAKSVVAQTLEGLLQPVEVTVRPYGNRPGRWTVTISIL